MPIVVIVLALMIYAFAMIAWPGFRGPGLALGGAVGLGLVLYFWIDASETEEAAARITPDDLVLDALAIDRTIRGAALTGRVLNPSERHRLQDMTLALRLRDCSIEAAALEECPVVAEDTAIARPDAPPGQARSFTANFLFDDLPPPSASHRWNWSILGVRATPDR